MNDSKNFEAFNILAERALENIFGLENNEHDFPEFHGFDITGIPSLARACLKTAGVSVPSHDQRQIFARALSSSDFPKLLANVGTKILQKAFKLQPRTYQYWMRIWKVPNYHDCEIPRLGWPGELPEIKENGKYKYLSLVKGGESGRIITRGGLLAFTRALLVNDDQGALKERAKGGGLIAARTISRRAYGALLSPGNLSDGQAFFHDSRGNLLTGSSDPTYALNATSLAAAVEKLRSQKTDAGDAIDFEPKFLLVPPALEVDAWNLCYSSSVPGQDNSGVSNIFRDKFGLIPIVSPELADAALGGNSRDWYLFSDPDKSTACFRMLTFKDEWPEPFLDEKMMWNRDQIETKIRLDFEPMPISPLGCVKVAVHSG